MAAVEDFMFVEEEKDFQLTFFYCCLCPLTIPFLDPINAYSYRDGHKHNAYHKRRLELRR